MAVERELRFKATIDDVEGHAVKLNGMWQGDPDDVEAHGIKLGGKRMTGEDVEGHMIKAGSIENIPDDTEGHVAKIGGKFRFELELEDGDVKGHLQHLAGSQLTGTDDDGNRVQVVIDKVDGDDVEGHSAKIGG